MAEFIVIHQFIDDADRGLEAMNELEQVKALVEADGKTVPGRCSLTWLPFSYGHETCMAFAWRMLKPLCLASGIESLLTSCRW